MVFGALKFGFGAPKALASTPSGVTFCGCTPVENICPNKPLLNPACRLLNPYCPACRDGWRFCCCVLKTSRLNPSCCCAACCCASVALLIACDCKPAAASWVDPCTA